MTTEVPASGSSAEKAAPRFEGDHCANCFEPLPEDKTHRPWLFCSELCKEIATLIRYWRKVSRDGRLERDPDVAYSIQIRIAHILAGGYNRQARKIPAETRRLVKDRDKVCVECGAPGEEIDHIDGDSNDPGNLQYLCKSCHHAKTDSHLGEATDDDHLTVLALYLERVEPDQAVQLCDDPSWETVWRRLQAERRKRTAFPEPDPWKGIWPPE